STIELVYNMEVLSHEAVGSRKIYLFNIVSYNLEDAVDFEGVGQGRPSFPDGMVSIALIIPLVIVSAKLGDFVVVVVAVSAKLKGNNDFPIFIFALNSHF
ncbi:hypothetical protein A2U01_0010446, partial [Trifolium medium]|nr:hypothetical protein [Trifolium medium]